MEKMKMPVIQLDCNKKKKEQNIWQAQKSIY